MQRNDLWCRKKNDIWHLQIFKFVIIYFRLTCGRATWHLKKTEILSYEIRRWVSGTSTRWAEQSKEYKTEYEF